MEAGEANAKNRLLELEVAGAIAAMRDEEVWNGPVTRAARRWRERLKRSSGRLWNHWT